MLSNKSNTTELSDIEAFICVVQSGSFTAAAEQMNTSKSVVSKYISRLEQRLGVKLMTRTTRRLTLTEIGRSFYDNVLTGIETIREAENEVSYLQGAPRGTLKINAPLSFGVMHLTPLIKKFKEEYSEVDIDIRFDDKKVDMVKEGLDLTIRIADQLEGNIIARRLAPCHHAIVAAPSYIEKYGKPFTPESLQDHNIITYQYQYSRWEWELVSPDNKTSRIKVHGNIQMNNTLAIKEAIIAGAGIARMPTFAVGEDIKSGRLIHLLPKYQLLKRTIYCVYQDRKNIAPKLRAFIDFMVKHIKENPVWDDF